MRRLLMSRLIRIFTLSLVDLFAIPKNQIRYKLGRCSNLADRPILPGPPGINKLCCIFSFQFILQKLNGLLQRKL